MLLRGEYGGLPGTVNEEVRKKAIGDDKVITCRPADLLEPEMEHLKEITRNFAHCDEDVLSYALFQQMAADFLNKKYHSKKKEVVHEINVEWLN
jgi:oxaloacetate decarboxylase alpha subunit